MNVEITHEGQNSLAAYASVPSAFRIRGVIDVSTLSLGSARLTIRSEDRQRTKDYDAYPKNDPLSWPTRFTVDNWILLAAYDQNHDRVGGAAVVTDSDGVADVGGRPTYAVLWDIRVVPLMRGRGISRVLLAAAEAVARAAGCDGLDAETQDINVAACCLYAANDYTLSRVVPGAYDVAPDEVQLVWSKQFV